MRYIMRAKGREQRLSVADLTTDGPDVMSEQLLGRRVAVVYSDPPWNPGNEKYWRRYAAKEPPTSYDRLLDGWVKCAVMGDPDHILVEQSVNAQHRNMLRAAIERSDGWSLPFVEEWVVLYGSPKRENVLMHFGKTKLHVDPTGLSGKALTRAVFSALDLPTGSLVMDPCMGLGTTSRMAHEFGLDCVGTELNAARLERTKATLRRFGYTEEAA